MPTKRCKSKLSSPPGYAVPAYALCFGWLSGCNASPSQTVFGSLFPSWLFCVFAGIGMTIIVRMLFVAGKIDAVLPVPFVVYLAMSTAFSFAVWIVWLA